MSETPQTLPTGPSQRPRALPAVLVAFSAAVFAWTLWEGYALALHRLIPHAVEKHETSLAVALSDAKHRLNKGYACYLAVHHALQQGGITSHPVVLAQGGYTYPDNMRDPELLDRAICQAAEMPDPWRSGIRYCPVFAEDVGYADFAKLAFRVFGYRLSSLYACYFLLLGVSLAAYLLAYRRDVPMLLLLVAFQLMLFLVVRSIPLVGTGGDDPGTPLQLGTVANGRFLSTLGIVPFLHLAGALLRRPRPSAGLLLTALVQAAALGFALHFRGSALWTFVAFGLVAAGAGAVWFAANRRGMLDRAVTPRGLLGGAARLWPVAAVAAALGGQKAYLASATHWTYQTDVGLPHHLMWHNALMSLSAHPDWPQQALRPPDNPLNDSLPVRLVEDRLDAEGVGREYLFSPLTNSYKARLHDQLCRTIYVEFAKAHPGYVAELILWYKPRAVARCVADNWGWLRPGLLRWDSLVLLAAFAASAVAARRDGAVTGWGVTLAIPAAAFAGAVLPLLWTFPYYPVMSDLMISIGLVVLCGLPTLAASVARVRRSGVRVSLPAVGRRVTG